MCVGVGVGAVVVCGRGRESETFRVYLADAAGQSEFCFESEPQGDGGRHPYSKGGGENSTTHKGEGGSKQHPKGEGGEMHNTRRENNGKQYHRQETLI